MSQVTASTFKFFLVIIASVAIRLLLIYSSYRKEISERVEVSTPVSSWKRVTEAVHLIKIGVSPYDGDTFHETPLFLAAYNWLLSGWSNWVPTLFVLVDVLTAIILAVASSQQLHDCIDWEETPLGKLKDKVLVKKLTLERSHIVGISVSVGCTYLLLPYSILSCVGQSTSVFQNLMVASLLLAATTNQRVISMALAALIAHTSMYGIVLVVPSVLILEHQRSRERRTHKYIPVDFSSSRVIASMVMSVMICVSFLAALTFTSSWLVNHSCDWISATYLFHLSVPDLTPNIGVFWYFFTEMFDHFRDFFLWTFQINAFLYTIPLAISLRGNPYMMFFIQLILLSVLKPYPSVSDLALYLPFLFQWAHLRQYLKHSLVSGAMLVTCSVLAPILWHLWIMMGTANSNFYFGVTLAYNTAQILLVTDYFFAFTKRQYYLNNGMSFDDKKKPKVLELVYEFSQFGIKSKEKKS